MLAMSAPVMFLFAIRVRSRSARDEATIIEPGPFRRRSFNFGLAMMLLFMGSMAGVSFALTLYMQYGLGFSPAEAGLAMMPFAVALIIGLVGIGERVNLIGRYVLLIGLVIEIAAMIVLAYTVQQDGIGFWQLQPALLLSGLGMGAIVGPLFGFVLADVGDRKPVRRRGCRMPVDQVASAAGLAALGSVHFASVPALVAPLAGFSHAMYVLALVSVPVFAILVFGMPRKARDEDTIEPV